MSTTLTYVGDHHLVSTAMADLVRLSLNGNIQVQYTADPRPLDLDNSALEVTVEGLLLDSPRERDWDFQQYLGLLLDELDSEGWKLVTLRHSGMYEVVEAEGDVHPSRVIAQRLTSKSLISTWLG